MHAHPIEWMMYSCFLPSSFVVWGHVSPTYHMKQQLLNDSFLGMNNLSILPPIQIVMSSEPQDWTERRHQQQKFIFINFFFFNIQSIHPPPPAAIAASLSPRISPVLYPLSQVKTILFAVIQLKLTCVLSFLQNGEIRRQLLGTCSYTVEHLN